MIADFIENRVGVPVGVSLGNVDCLTNEMIGRKVLFPFGSEFAW